ncbi:MAG: PLDc N-terminal domain-containing protein [Solirubrobacteraceae bacterium]
MDPITWSIGGLIGLVIFVVTVVSIVNNPNHGGLGKLIWILVTFFLSVLGSILWLIFGRGKVSKR